MSPGNINLHVSRGYELRDAYVSAELIITLIRAYAPINFPYTLLDCIEYDEDEYLYRAHADSKYNAIDQKTGQRIELGASSSTARRASDSSNDG